MHGELTNLIYALSALIEMAKNHGDTFKVALSISGVALEQLEVHAPGVIEYSSHLRFQLQ